MKLDKLKPGMIVYDVGRTRMGNTTMRTVSVWRVKILAVHSEDRTVTASWNGNASRTYHEGSWSKWRLKEPLLIRGAMGYARLATREEIAAAKLAKTQG